MKITMINKRKSRRGAALAYVIVVLVIISIFSLIIFNLALSNIAQAKSQEKDLQAYYLALSGSELCFTALLQEGTGGAYDTPLYMNFNPSITTHTLIQDELTLEQGTVQLNITWDTVDDERWITIESTANLNNSTTTRTVWLQFMYSNPLVQRKS